MSFGAGFAQAEDRLFLMDVLRHYGAGRMSSFLGPSCENERIDHDQLLFAPYTEEQAQAQVDALPARHGEQGALARDMLYSYVDGVNAYIARTRVDPRALPADYVTALAPPQRWTVADAVHISSLIGRIFGAGGGAEMRGAGLLQYLQGRLGNADAASAFGDLKEQNDPDAPTTVDTAFPYGQPGRVDPAATAMPDDAARPLRGGPTETTPGCDLTPGSRAATAMVAELLAAPRKMSNAMLVDGAHAVGGHPIAVMGPQVGYIAPGIVMQQDLHSPDYHAAGLSFPGTGLVGDLGRRRHGRSAAGAGVRSGRRGGRAAGNLL
jgi:acyl-homoserine lactone acylase PvdQ